MIFEEASDSKHIDLTTSWLREKYDLLNKELFDGKLGNCDFGIFTTGRGSSGRTLGLFSMENDNLKAERRTRRIYADTYFGKRYIYNDNDFERICKPKISLNGNYKWTEKAALSTLLHEMCHYYTYMNGFAPKQGHGWEFKSIASIVSSKSNNTFPVERIASAEEMKEVELNQEIAQRNERRKENKIGRMVPVFIYFTNGIVGMVPAMNTEVINDIIYIFKDRDTVEKCTVSHDEELKMYIEKHYQVSRKYKGWYRVQDVREIMDKLPSTEEVVFKNNNNSTNESVMTKETINEVLRPVIPWNEVYGFIKNEMPRLKQRGKVKIEFKNGPNGYFLAQLRKNTIIVNWFGETKQIPTDDIDNMSDETMAKVILSGLIAIYNKKRKSTMRNESKSKIVKLTESELRNVIKEAVNEISAAMADRAASAAYKKARANGYPITGDNLKKFKQGDKFLKYRDDKLSKGRKNVGLYYHFGDPDEKISLATYTNDTATPITDPADSIADLEKLPFKDEITNESRQNVLKLTESQLHQVIENVVRNIMEDTRSQRMKDPINQWFKDMNNAQRLRDTMDNVYGSSAKKYFDEIDRMLQQYGDAHVSRFYSDDNNLVVAVNKTADDRKDDIVRGIEEIGYKFTNAGENGEYVMLDFTSAR